MKKHIITAALPYANGELHLGHLRSTYLPPDIYVRFLRQLGDKAVYLCATDEHGTPILLSSEKTKQTAAEYVKQWRKRHLADLQSIGIEFDLFSHTHDPAHIKLTQDMYEKIKVHTFRSAVQQYWCPKEDKPLPDRYVIGQCPFCQTEEQYGDTCESCGKAIPPGKLIEPSCKTCGAAAIVKKKEHIFFRLSAFADRLASWIENELDTTQDIKNFSLEWAKELRDWDITRDIDWGVPIPDYDGVFYVWFDAPIGYMTALRKWCTKNGEKFEDWWNPGSEIVHFIGKDIVYHHVLFWPAMLMAAGFTLPTRVPVRGYLTLEGKKLSKSRGHYVSIADWTKAGQDPEYLRFYLSFTTPLGMRDTDFSAEEYRSVVNEGLVNNYGNLLQRVLKFSERFDSAIPDAKLGPIFNDICEKKKGFEQLMRKGKLMAALKVATGAASDINAYFQGSEPWKDEKTAPETIRTAASSLKLITQMLVPFIPVRAEKAAGLLNVKLEWADSKPLEAGHKLKSPEILFDRVSEDDVKKIKSIYGAS